ncbi:MAG: biotin--[acetyl-CoA-carboxylase] ligase [Crocinitomicaceae bacterium]|nr:biotin--[acetyl-CoA-carboxylase] ligase [Crocinitomicaceae bacterium]
MKNPETLFIGQHIIHLSDVDSTNNFAAKLVKQTKVISGTAILAENQSAGRGQSGNVWISNPGENLTFSLVLQPKLEAKNQFLISKIICLALIETLQSLKIEARIKWPNDILIRNKKIAGILIENTLKGKQIDNSIIGIGFNVNQAFGGDSNATSIMLETGKLNELKSILFLLFQKIETWYFQLEQSKTFLIDEAYEKVLFGLGEKRNYFKNDQSFSGTIIGVNEIGQLKIQSETGRIELYNNQEIKFDLA